MTHPPFVAISVNTKPHTPGINCTCNRILRARVCAETFEVTSLVWFRNDLRVADNPALTEACACGPVVACFVVSTNQWRVHDVGDRRLAFLGRSLNALARELAILGIPM
jgi:hypothetical protein